MYRTFRPLLLPALAIFVLGCGGAEESNRVPVKVTVTLDGSPVSAGRITFEAVGSTVSPKGFGSVKDGMATISKEQGPVPGDFEATLLISAESKAPAGKSGRGGEKPLVGRGNLERIKSANQEYVLKTKIPEPGESETVEVTLNFLSK